MSSRSAALALKTHCHRMVTALGSKTPPETFLFRGNAYLALDQPYFAVADYVTAMESIRLSGSHLEKANEALAKMPETLVGRFPAVDTHIQHLVQPNFSRDAVVKKVSEDVGRGVVAEADMSRGSLVLRPTDPWLLYPLQEDRCSNCGVDLPQRVVECSNPNCHEEYCSRLCRAEALKKYHSKVCMNREFQGHELALFAHLKSASTQQQRTIIAGYLMLMRIMAASVNVNTVPVATAEVRTLMGQLQFSPRQVGTDLQELYAKVSRALGVVTSVSFEEFVSVLARVMGNAFHTDEYVALFIARSFLNHSCESNVAEDPETKRMVTTRDVKAGEELVINYYPHLRDLPFEQRRKELMRRGFACRCTKCLAEK